VVQDVNYACAAHPRGVVHARAGEVGMFAQLFRAPFGKRLHVVLASKVQAASGAGLYAGRLKAFAHAVGTEGALEDAISLRVHLRDVERASRDAVTAADAVSLLEIHDTVGVLHDRAVGRARSEATRISAVHALILAHEPHQRAVFALVLVEEDQ